MIGSGLSLVIELIVSLLLVVTISYCYIVNRKLTALRTDQTGLRQVIAELNRSSDRAEQAIGQMRRTAQSVDGEMASHMEAVRQVREDLQDVLDRSADVRTIASRLADVDLNALKQFEQSTHMGSSVSNEQIAVTKELKRQRLGFGKDQFKGKPVVKPQQLQQPTKNPTQRHVGVKQAGVKQASVKQVGVKTENQTDDPILRKMMEIQNRSAAKGRQVVVPEQTQGLAANLDGRAVNVARVEPNYQDQQMAKAVASVQHMAQRAQVNRGVVQATRATGERLTVNETFYDRSVA